MPKIPIVLLTVESFRCHCGAEFANPVPAALATLVRNFPAQDISDGGL